MKGREKDVHTMQWVYMWDNQIEHIYNIYIDYRD